MAASYSETVCSLFFKKRLYSVVQEEIALCLPNLTAVLEFQHGTPNSARSALFCITGISINGVPVGQHPRGFSTKDNSAPLTMTNFLSTGSFGYNIQVAMIT